MKRLVPDPALTVEQRWAVLTAYRALAGLVDLLLATGQVPAARCYASACRGLVQAFAIRQDVRHVVVPDALHEATGHRDAHPRARQMFDDLSDRKVGVGLS